MSRSDVRPKTHAQPAPDRHQDNSTRADKISRVQKDKKVKEVEEVKVEDKVVPKIKKEKKNTTEAQAVDKTQEKDKRKAGTKVESDKTSSVEQQVALASGGAEGRQPDAVDVVDLANTDSPKNPKTLESLEAGENPEAQENLKEIEYLHLPSKSLSQLEERLHYSPNARRKFRLWKETMGMCVYCGKHINALDFVSGIESDIEHILPQALGGTSAFENLVCSCRKCNRDKRDMTAMDYVLTLNSRQQSNYLNRLRLLASSGSISEQKYFNLLRPVMLMNLDKRIP